MEVKELLEKFADPEYQKKLFEQLDKAEGVEYVKLYNDSVKAVTSVYRMLEEVNSKGTKLGITVIVEPGQENILDEMKND